MKLVLLVLFSIFAINSSYASEKKEQFQARMKKDLASFDAEIERLKEKSSEAAGNAKDQIDEQLKKVEVQRMTVTEKMGELSRSSGDAWKEVKKGVESAYSEMKNAFKKASSHFKK